MLRNRATETEFFLENSVTFCTLHFFYMSQEWYVTHKNGTQTCVPYELHLLH